MSFLFTCWSGIPSASALPLVFQLPAPQAVCCVPSRVMKICMNSTGVNKIEQTDKLLLETLHETRSKSEEAEEEGEG